jgi:hypothetical protein
MTLHGRSVAWSLSVLAVLVAVSGCGGKSGPCPHPRPYPDHGTVSDIESVEAPDVTGSLSLTYREDSGAEVSSATPLKQNGVNFYGSEILHVPLAGLSTAGLGLSVPSQSATASAWDFDVTLYLLNGVQGTVTYYGASMTEAGAETNYQATLVNPGSGILTGTPGVQMMVDLKKSDGSVSKIWVLINLDDQNPAKEGV